MKLRKPTRALLQLVAPDWVENLDSVSWNVGLLGSKLRNALTNEVTECFMGEIYCYTAAYCSGDRECITCKLFCGEIPRVLQYETDDRKKDIMEELAKHLKEVHKQLIKNKKAGKD